MSRKHPGVVRLDRAPFSKEWRVVKVAADRRTITDTWTLHEEDAAALERLYAPEPTAGSAATRLYIAGPMTGYPDFNYPAFHAAAEHLRAAGYDVLNPADSEAENTTGEPQEWTWYMRRAIAMLVQADGIALLPGWTESKGARLEAYLAEVLDMQAQRVEAWLGMEDVPAGAIDAQRAHEEQP